MEHCRNLGGSSGGTIDIENDIPSHNESVDGNSVSHSENNEIVQECRKRAHKSGEYKNDLEKMVSNALCNPGRHIRKSTGMTVVLYLMQLLLSVILHSHERVLQAPLRWKQMNLMSPG